MTKRGNEHRYFEKMSTGLKNELLDTIDQGANPYLMYALSMLNYLGLHQNIARDADLNHFMQTFQFSVYDDLMAPNDPNIQEERAQFAGMLYGFYLWRTSRGKALWQSFLKWLPLDLRKRQQVDLWDKKAHFSLFEAQGLGFSLKDLYSNQEFILPSHLMELVDPLRPKERGIAWLLPLKDSWFPLCLLPLELSDQQLASFKQKDVSQWEQSLLQTGADYLAKCSDLPDLPAEEEDYIDQITKEFMAEIDDLFENFADFPCKHSTKTKEDFPSLGLTGGQSPAEFAQRLLKQDVAFRDFPHLDCVTAFVTQVVTTYPELFFAKLDGTYFLDALRMLLTKLDSYFEEQISDNGDTTFFWYLFLTEHFPQEIANLAPYKVPMTFWQEED